MYVTQQLCYQSGEMHLNSGPSKYEAGDLTTRPHRSKKREDLKTNEPPNYLTPVEYVACLQGLLHSHSHF